MKAPAWIVFDAPTTLSEDGRSVVFTVRVRRWHPGLWLYVIRTLLASRLPR